MGYLGGVSRRAEYVRRVREAGGDVVVVDLGDALMGAGKPMEAKAEVFADAYRHMNYAAVAIGDYDLRYIRDGHPKPYADAVCTICANVTNAAGGDPIATKPWSVCETSSGLRVGIIAVLGEDALSRDDQAKLGLRVESPASALARELPKLRERCDTVLLLAHTGCDTARRLAGLGVDAVLAAHPPMIAQDGPERIGGIPVMQTWVAGKCLGRLTIEIGPSGRVTDFSGQHVPLRDDIPDDPEMSGSIARYDRALEAFYARGPAPDSDSGESGPRDPRPFVSPSKCAECHLKEYAQWSNSGHAMAFEHLRPGNHSSEVECALCHSTGLRSKGGFRSEASTPELRGVGCEACHGPGVRHVRRPGKGYGAVLRSPCADCHDAGHDPGFGFEKDMMRIRHGK